MAAAGPTLEQVLARSMQLPAARAAKVFNMAMRPPTLPDGSPIPALIPTKKKPTPGGDPAAPDAAKEDLWFRAAKDGDVVGEAEADFPMHAPAEAVERPQRRYLNGQDFTSFVFACRQMGDWKAALEALGAIARAEHDFAPNQVQVQHLVEACAAAGQSERLEEALATEWAPHRPDVSAAGVATSDGTSTPAAEGNPFAATQKDGSAAGAGKLDGYTAVEVQLIDAYGQVEEWAAALRVLGRMAEGPKGAAPDQQRRYRPPAAFNAAIAACERGLQWERALGLVEEMKGEGLTPDSVTYAALVAALEAAEKPSEVRRLLAAMPKAQSDTVVTSYTALVDVWASKHTKRALKRF